MNDTKKVMSNSKHFSETLQAMGYVLVSGGTDNHLMLVNLKKSKSIDGARVERVLELANLTTNKNTVPGDVSAMTPGGMRMGTPALTSRGLTEQDFTKIAEFFDRGVGIALKVKEKTGKKLADFKKHLANGADAEPELVALANEVSEFAQTFPTAGYTEESMKFR